MNEKDDIYVFWRGLIAESIIMIPSISFEDHKKKVNIIIFALSSAWMFKKPGLNETKTFRTPKSDVFETVQVIKIFYNIKIQ